MAWVLKSVLGEGGQGRTGLGTFRPREPCSPAGPSCPLGPWRRRKVLAQWTARLSSGCEPGGRAARSQAFPCTSRGSASCPPAHCHWRHATLRSQRGGTADGMAGRLRERPHLSDPVGDEAGDRLAHSTDVETEGQSQGPHGRVSTPLLRGHMRGRGRRAGDAETWAGIQGTLRWPRRPGQTCEHAWAGSRGGLAAGGGRARPELWAPAGPLSSGALGSVLTLEAGTSVPRELGGPGGRRSPAAVPVHRWEH